MEGEIGRGCVDQLASRTGVFLAGFIRRSIRESTWKGHSIFERSIPTRAKCQENQWRNLFPSRSRDWKRIVLWRVTWSLREWVADPSEPAAEGQVVWILRFAPYTPARAATREKRLAPRVVVIGGALTGTDYRLRLTPRRAGSPLSLSFSPYLPLPWRRPHTSLGYSVDLSIGWQTPVGSFRSVETTDADETARAERHGSSPRFSPLRIVLLVTCSQVRHADPARFRVRVPVVIHARCGGGNIARAVSWHDEVITRVVLASAGSRSDFGRWVHLPERLRQDSWLARWPGHRLDRR